MDHLSIVLLQISPSVSRMPPERTAYKLNVTEYLIQVLSKVVFLDFSLSNWEMQVLGICAIGFIKIVRRNLICVMG